MTIIPISTAPLPARRQLIAAIVAAFTAFPRSRSSAQRPAGTRVPTTSKSVVPASILVSPLAR